MKEGVRLYKKGEYSDALSVFLGIPSSEAGGNSELAYFIGLCFARLGKHEDALVYLEQVVTVDTDLARVYQCRLTLAVLYVFTGRTRLADFELKKLIESGYESPQVFSSLGFIAYSFGKVEESLDWYEKALELDDSNSTALNGLGYILADVGRDLTRALSLCKKAFGERIKVIVTSRLNEYAKAECVLDYARRITDLAIWSFKFGDRLGDFGSNEILVDLVLPSFDELLTENDNLWAGDYGIFNVGAVSVTPEDEADPEQAWADESAATTFRFSDYTIKDNLVIVESPAKAKTIKEFFETANS